MEILTGKDIFCELIVYEIEVTPRIVVQYGGLFQFLYLDLLRVIRIFQRRFFLCFQL
ncbi:hypothetical protein J2Y03_004565 [Neobacillus niacini]|nr:hypothetical protein [Neobacillus niacini]